MTEATEATANSPRRIAVSLVASAALVLVALSTIHDPLRARAAAVAGTCLVLWLSEAVPPFVPTLLLLAVAPVVLGGFGPEHGFAAMVATAADPILGLFFGGFALAVAAERHGVDTAFTHLLLRWSRGSRHQLVAALLLGTALLSMWMSYIAVAAMMMGAIAPILSRLPRHDRLRQGLLLAIAIGANIGAMSTPVASGPNAIAVGAAQSTHPISFIAWMTFAIPLMAILLAVAYALLLAWLRGHGSVELELGARERLRPSGFAVIALGGATAMLWLTEPLHGVSAPVVALALAAALFTSRLLSASDLGAIDWSTLLLIAGGLAVGRLCEHAGLVAIVAEHIARLGGDTAVLPWIFMPLAAILGSVVSNAGTAALLIPLAMTVDPHPPTLAITVALGVSLGMPFAISSPANAVAHGRGLHSWRLLVFGCTIMVVGCVLIALTGRFALGRFGFG